MRAMFPLCSREGGPVLQPVAPPADAAPLLLALLGRTAPAGFPSPADDYLEGEIDLARLLVERDRRRASSCASAATR